MQKTGLVWINGAIRLRKLLVAAAEEQRIFPDEMDQDFLINYKSKPVPEIKPELEEYLSSYIGESDFRSLMDHARSRFFDCMDDFDMDWAQHSMETALRLFSFPGKSIGLEDSTESDILMRLWIFIDKAFDDVPVDIHSGGMESRASSERKNKGRELGERNAHGQTADLLLKCTIGELGCGEIGRRDQGGSGTEGGLKFPKMMKDMLCSLLSTSATVTDLETIGFVIMGPKLTLLRMDRPSRLTCRLSRSTPKYFPQNLTHFSAEMGSLLALVWQAKAMVCRTFASLQTQIIEGAKMSSVPSEVLPPCAKSPPPKNKKRRLRF